jgi:hypothetical protein
MSQQHEQQDMQDRQNTARISVEVLETDNDWQLKRADIGGHHMYYAYLTSCKALVLNRWGTASCRLHLHCLCCHICLVSAKHRLLAKSDNFIVPA